jgi:hypothetical protein
MLKQGSLFALTKQGYLERLDTTFNPVANSLSSQNYNSGKRVIDFCIANDTVYAVTQHTNNVSYGLLRLDTNLSLVSFNTNSSPYHTVGGIAVNGTQAYMVADHFVPANSYSVGSYHPIPYVSLISIPTNTIYSFQHDIALASVTLDSSFPLNTYTTNNVAFVDTKFKMTIKNTGTTTINSFYITADRGSFAGDPCYRNLIHKRYDSLSVAPGDSIVVSTDPVYGLLQNYSFPNYVTISNICFVATAPNDQNDNSPISNINCPNISINATGLYERTNEVSQVIIFPNPAYAVVHFNHLDENTEVVFTNIMGMVCRKYINPGSIDISDLKEGLYFVQINTRMKKTMSVKLVVQR